MVRKFQNLCLGSLASFAAVFLPSVMMGTESLESNPVNLRCDAMTNPLGVDSEFPEFSWRLPDLAVRGGSQTGWEIRVASSRELLSAGQGDLWESGRHNSDEQLHVPYAGRALHSDEQLFWQVRVWNGRRVASAWSDISTLTMGVLRPEDWASAKWIADPAWTGWQRTKLGFSSRESADPDSPQWIQLDLGSSQPLDRVRFYSVRSGAIENIGFPSRFKLETADDVTFARPRTIVDSTTKDYGNPWNHVIDIAAAGVSARFLRLTVPHLRVEEGMARLALSQIEVLSAGKNIATNSVVSASNSLEDRQWGASSVVDGLAVPATNPHSNSTLLLRKEFIVRAGLKRALLDISGLGFYTFHLNGGILDCGLLTPGWTDFSKSVLYDTRDITASLHEGVNAAGVELASGMYNVQMGRYTKFVTAYMPLMALVKLRLEYADGSTQIVTSDSTWRSATGPTTFSNIYGGEDYDARLEPIGWDRPHFDDQAWTPVVESNGPGGVLKGASHASPSFKVFQTLTPVGSHELSPDVTVYDLGQNASLMLHLRVHGASGSSVKVTPAELVYSDGRIDRRSSAPGAEEASWKYTLAGSAGEEDWRPRYFYHGSRYLKVERKASPSGGALPEVEVVEGLVAHSDSPPVGEFSCSNELFNRIYSLIRWAQANNLAHVLTDCPHRERLGWLEQYHLNGPALRYEWSLDRLYRKSFDDMEDAQLSNGLVPDIAPEYVKFSGGFRDSPEWGSALVLAAWQQYIWTGDDAPLREHYTAMQRYVDYLTSRSREGIVSYGLGDWYDRGPKPPGFAQLTPVALTATAFYYLTTETFSKISARVNRSDNAARYSAQAEKIKAAFNRRFFDPVKDLYATGSQTACALPLVLDLVPAGHRDAVLSTLVDNIRKQGNATTAGDIGYRYVLRALADGGRSDVVYEMTAQTEKPGYGYQLAHGATSLTEAWDAAANSSQDHFMLGQLMEWFYHDLAGLAPDPVTPGFKRVLIAPQPEGNIAWAKARYQAAQGIIEVSWQKNQSAFVLDLILPPNTSAEVSIPAIAGQQVLEGVGLVEMAAGVRFLRKIESHAVYDVRAGHYHFSVNVAPRSP